MPNLTDTIVAPITAPGRGAIAGVRVSGPSAFAVARSVSSGMPAKPEPRYAIYGRFSHGDDGLILPFDSASYTGEESVELFVHGSPMSVSLLVDACLVAGARLAEPGEFTLRAFMNGRIDLTQAEAVVEVVGSQTASQLRASGEQLAGAMSRRIQPALDAIDAVIVRNEAALDFSEELGPIDYGEQGRLLAGALQRIEECLAFEAPAEVLRQGLRVAILGRPNAGKSSLFNRLTGCDRAIVTGIPGTTRDVLEATVDVRGIPMVFLDTAGLRNTDEPVESIGIERSLDAASRADKTLYLYDCTTGLTSQDEEILASLDNPIRVAAKADLEHARGSDLEASADTGLGLDALLDALAEQTAELEVPFLLNRRHSDHLRQARQALQEAIATGDDHPDLLLPALYSAAQSLRHILGLGVAPDIIDQIFARFCIGK